MAGGAIVTQKQALKTFRGLLQRMRPQVAMALPKEMSADRMVRMCMSVVQQNPKLLDCSTESVLGCIMTSAQLGLYPDNSVLGHAYFVPYKKKCTFIAGYKGLINLASRSGKVTSIMGYAVYDGDPFEFEYGLMPVLKHKPSGEPIESRELTHTYGIARMLNEQIPQFVVMSKEEIDKIRARSPAYQRKYGPWVDDYEPMAIKTVLRRLCKYLPLTSELQRAIGLDEHADIGLDQGLETVGNEVLEGLADPDDPDTIDADFEVEGEPETKPLDNLAEEMTGKDPDAYTKAWARGHDKFGEVEWKKTVDEIYTKLKIKRSTKYAALTDEQKAAITQAMEKAI